MSLQDKYTMMKSVCSALDRALYDARLAERSDGGTPGIDKCLTAFRRQIERTEHKARIIRDGLAGNPGVRHRK